MPRIAQNMGSLFSVAGREGRLFVQNPSLKFFKGKFESWYHQSNSEDIFFTFLLCISVDVECTFKIIF